MSSKTSSSSSSSSSSKLMYTSKPSSSSSSSFDDEVDYDRTSYDCKFTAYALGWSNKDETIAIASFEEDEKNALKILNVEEEEIEKVSEDGERSLIKRIHLKPKSEHDLTFPTASLKWHPSDTNVLATAGDHLRVWNLEEKDDLDKQQEIYRNEKHAPLASLDWNEVDKNVIAAANYDQKQFSCTIWDVEKKNAVAEMRLNDEKSNIYDVSFQQTNKDVFGTVGEDGCVRLFDMRNLDRFTTLYRDPKSRPMLSLKWNKQMSFYVAVMLMGSKQIDVLDIRAPKEPVLELCGHAANVNAMEWAPHSGSHICTVGDDKQAYIWDLSRPSAVKEPILSYGTTSKINNVVWPSMKTDYVAITAGTALEVLRV